MTIAQKIRWRRRWNGRWKDHARKMKAFRELVGRSNVRTN